MAQVTPDEARLAELRLEYISARSALLDQVNKMCPNVHHAPTMHRDNRPAWCNHCGRTQTGMMVGEPRATE